jgi:hypothetical protein
MTALASSDVNECNSLVAFQNCSGGAQSVDKMARRITVRGITLRRKKRGSTQLEMHLPSDLWLVIQKLETVRASQSHTLISVTSQYIGVRKFALSLQAADTGLYTTPLLT